MSLTNFEKRILGYGGHREKEVRQLDEEVQGRMPAKSRKDTLRLGFDDFNDAMYVFEFVTKGKLLDVGEVEISEDDRGYAIHLANSVVERKPEIALAILATFEERLHEDTDMDMYESMINGINSLVMESNPWHEPGTNKAHSGSRSQGGHGGEFASATPKKGSSSLVNTQAPGWGGVQFKGKGKGRKIINTDCGRLAREQGDNKACYLGGKAPGSKQSKRGKAAGSKASRFKKAGAAAPAPAAKPKKSWRINASYSDEISQLTHMVAEAMRHGLNLSENDEFDTVHLNNLFQARAALNSR